MNFLIVSRVSIPAKDRTLPCWEYLRSLGHTVVVEHPDNVGMVDAYPEPDVMISMGVTVMEETFRALRLFPEAALYCYNWDVYAWVWQPGLEGKVQAKHASRPNEYDYVRYGELLRRAREVWVPSYCTGTRTTQWYGPGIKWHRILSACPWWDHPNVRDDGYALCCLREIPDPHWGLFERACEELGIPYRMPKHEKSYEEYQDLVAGCRFICAPLYELSTGGLSLMEAYRLGKPVLISDSPWNGGKDYFGARANYFFDGDLEDLKDEISFLMDLDSPAGVISRDHREYIERNFSDKRMVDDMLARIKATGGKR